MTQRVYIDEVRQGKNNPIYDISFCLHGRTYKTMKGVREPITTAAREMAADGLTGPLELWDRERPYPRMIGDIEKLSRLTVTEGQSSGPRFAKFVEFKKGE